MNLGRRSVRIAGLIVLAISAWVLAPALLASAAGPMPDEDVTIFNEDYTLEAGQTVDGDLAVIKGDLTLEGGSKVRGSVFVWSGDADIDGAVYLDVVVTQGDIYLEDGAIIDGNVVCGWNCELTRAEGAVVEGNVVHGAPIPLPDITGFDLRADASERRVVVERGAGRWLSWLLRVIQAFVGTIVLAAIAAVVGAVLPNRTETVGRTVLAAPIQSGGIGILTTIAIGVLVVVLAITICFLPIAALIALALGAAGLFGWVGIGAVVGGRLLRSIGAETRSPVWAAALGTLIISLLTMFVGLVRIPCLGFIAWIASVLVGCIGLGAVVLSRVGGIVYDPQGSKAIGSDAAPPRPGHDEGQAEPQAPELAGGDQEEPHQADDGAVSG